MSNDAKLLFAEKIKKVFNEAYEEVKRIRKITDDKQRADEAIKAKLALTSA